MTERDEPQWVLKAMARALHAEQVREHGGSLGLRDEGLLESALARARNRWAHDETADLAGLAAAYGFGLARNHPFVDGNKRVAFQVMYLFLGLNGYRIRAPEPEVVEVMLTLAAGEVDEEELAGWIRAHMEAR